MSTNVITPGEQPIKAIVLNTNRTDDLRRAMHAAVAPFGSLSPGIADLVIAYVGSDAVRSHTVDAGIALLRATREVDGEWSEVMLGAFRAQLITPTSGTLIELRRYAGGWTVRVDFGAAGSSYRASIIVEHDESITSQWCHEFAPGPGAEIAALCAQSASRGAM